MLNDVSVILMCGRSGLSANTGESRLYNWMLGGQEFETLVSAFIGVIQL